VLNVFLAEKKKKHASASAAANDQERLSSRRTYHLQIGDVRCVDLGHTAGLDGVD
jgi:hypothetical protein